MQKKVLISLAGVLLVMIAVATVYMAVGMHRMHKSGGDGDRMSFSQGHMQAGYQLTDEQKKELAPLMTQLVDVHKQIAQKLVADGVLAQKDADVRIANMQKMMDKNLQEGRIMGAGFMNGHSRDGDDKRDANCGNQGQKKNFNEAGNLNGQQMPPPPQAPVQQAPAAQ